MVKSEFGMGLTYCLGLFLCHSERSYGNGKASDIYDRPGLWFNAAGDHLFDLQIPEVLPDTLKVKLKEFREKVLGWRCALKDEDEPTKENKTWAIQEAKDLLRLIDEFHGIKTGKGHE